MIVAWFNSRFFSSIVNIKSFLEEFFSVLCVIYDSNLVSAQEESEEKLDEGQEPADWQSTQEDDKLLFFLRGRLVRQ